MLYFSFKPVSPEMYPAVTKLIGEGFSEDRRLEMLSSAGTGDRLLFALDNGEGIIGVASLVFDCGDSGLTIAGKRMNLADVFVDPDWRRQGYGGMLIEYGANQAQELSYDELSAEIDESDSGLKKLLYGHGFIRESENIFVRDLNAEHKCKGCAASR